MNAPLIRYTPSGNRNWAESAACARPDAPSMFPHEKDAEDTELAKDICKGCPVARACLEEAMQRGEQFGIWGGLTPDERRARHRRSTRKAVKG